MSKLMLFVTNLNIILLLFRLKVIKEYIRFIPTFEFPLRILLILDGYSRLGVLIKLFLHKNSVKYEGCSLTEKISGREG